MARLKARARYPKELLVKCRLKVPAWARKESCNSRRMTFRRATDVICRDDEIAIACIDDGRVLANLRSNDQPRITLWQMPQQRSQVLKRKFADWKNLVRSVASHALTLAPSP
jgi:hypothetical protein